MTTARSARAFYLYATFLPLASTALASALGRVDRPDITTAAALCVTANYVLQYRSYRVLMEEMRELRHRAELSFTRLQVIGGLFLGFLVEKLWNGLPALHGNELWTALAVSLIPLLIMRPVYTLRLHPVVWLLSNPYRVLFDKGVLVLYAALETHSPGLLWLALWLAICDLPGSVGMAVQSRSPGWEARVNDAHHYLDSDAETRRILFEEPWLRDFVRNRSGRPDLGFVHTLAHEAARSVQQTRAMTLDLDGLSAFTVRPGLRSLDWADAALALLERAENAVPRTPEARRRFRLARAHCAYARALIYSATGHRDEFRASFTEACTIWRQEGHQDVAAVESALSYLNSSGEKLFLVLTPADGLALLDPPVHDPTLTPLVRRYTLLAVSLVHQELGEPEPAAKLKAEALAQRPRWGDSRRLLRQYRAAGLPRKRSAISITGRLLALATGPVADFSQFAPSSAPTIALDSWPPSQARDHAALGLRMWDLGRRDQAEALLMEAVRLLRASDQLVAAFYVLLELGRAQHDSAPWRAYHTLNQAAEVYETLRMRILDDEVRLSTGASIERLTLLTLGLLLDAPEGGGPWPRTPRAAAFALVERARSRGLLELLGTTVPPGATAPPDLVAAEAEARRIVADRRAALAAAGTPAGSEAALRGLRDALSALARVQDRIAAVDLAGEEYVNLSRGTPLTFAEVKALLRPEESG
ncbi:hypothetical protein [Microbispora catharanthi]|uniref:Tetratricopeptide repeat protein n=1 Tax=Microbispora catharanthi TaxID=1712871 RepID=A0A5N6B9X3_9ACTN|nr:hypothetical protein [Microbispora catharanthi]KAB8176799.1 hypothetical protein FH610_038235 [Microbispora catharanthi]